MGGAGGSHERGPRGRRCARGSSGKLTLWVRRGLAGETYSHRLLPCGSRANIERTRRGPFAVGCTAPLAHLSLFPPYPSASPDSTMGLFKRLSFSSKPKPSSQPPPAARPPPPRAPPHIPAPAPSSSLLDPRTEDALRALAKYDTVFLVDDSGSMEPMWETELAPALAGAVRTAVQYDDVRALPFRLPLTAQAGPRFGLTTPATHRTASTLRSSTRRRHTPRRAQTTSSTCSAACDRGARPRRPMPSRGCLSRT